MGLFVSSLLSSSNQEDVFFLDLRLQHPDGTVLAENRYIFTRTENLAPLLSVPGTQLKVVLEPGAETAADDWQVRLTNRGECAALFVRLEDEIAIGSKVENATGRRGYAYFSDNDFSLLPGESRLVAVEWDHVFPEERRVAVKGWNTGEEKEISKQ